ncbi:phage adaptor protein [Marinomonas atlantica]|uniref:phage adaptor protein n=1 Tax=Marinomonas atlantica TaxID=1806668 RepID=UPI00083569BA|nr:DUF6682 family protein [Marinomonas atlantica]
MAVTTLGNVINRVKTTLQETTDSGTRWTNGELIEWVNESYQAIIQIKPEASTINMDVELKAGTKQTIPANGLRLIDVVRCVSESSSGAAVTVCDRRQLDTARRGWHREPQTLDVEHFIFDEMDPKTFYVYPPAQAGAQIELMYSALPDLHSSASNAIPNDSIRFDDTLAPVIVDYVLYRAYSKDADHTANLNRAQMHYQAFMQSLGQKTQIDRATSPNAG